MTTESEALPNPVLDQSAPPTPAVETDPDVLELQAAEAAAKVEEAAARGEAPQPAAGAAAAPAVTAAKDPEHTVPTIPKPRFDEVLGRATKAEQDAAYWRGRAEAVQPATPAKTEQTQQPTPQDRISELRAEKLAAAKEFDDGQITQAQFEQRKDDIEDKVQAIREENLLARIPKPSAATGTDDSLYLHQQTQQAVTQHPWVDVFEKVGTDADWAFVRARAADDMKERGFDTSNKAATDLELRQTMARLMDELGPTLVAGRATKAGITVPASQQQSQATPPASQQKATLSPAAQARTAKLDLAAGAPLNLSTLSGAAEDGMPSAAALDAMNDEEMADLLKRMPGLEAKILGATAA